MEESNKELKVGDYVVALRPWNNYEGREQLWINASGRVMIVSHDGAEFGYRSDVRCSYFRAHPAQKFNDDEWWFNKESLLKITPEQANDPNFRRWMYACYSGDTEPLKEME